MATKPAVWLACVGLACAPASAAQDKPLSAIDWLSDSIAAPQTPPQANATPDATAPGNITVLPLDAPVADSAGLMAASQLGMDPQLWGRSSARDLAEALGRVQISADTSPALRGFFRDLIRARFAPPIDAAIDEQFFFARVDRLLGLGHLQDAARLIDISGNMDAERFRRSFDIALLSGTETTACRQLETSPSLSPTLPTRIFCLARLGEWDVAALTLGNAETLGILSDREDRLLLHFLDPELFEGEPLPPAPRVPSPLLFRLYEAVGERMSTSALPVAFAVTDLSNTVGWKTRLRAAERLAAVEAIPIEALFEVYQEREPAASGAEWDRVAALQTLLETVEAQSPIAISKTLPDAWAAAQDADYTAPFARWLAPKLADLAADDISAGRRAVFEIALLARDTKLAARFSDGSSGDSFLLALANGTQPPPAQDALARAVLRGLSAFGPDPTYQALMDDDRTGEALLRALAQLSEGAAGNPNSTAHSLAFLRTLGLDGLARQIAVELLLMESTA